VLAPFLQVKGKVTCTPLRDEQFNNKLSKIGARLSWVGNMFTSLRWSCGGYLPWEQHPMGQYLRRIRALSEAAQHSKMK
jgi:hypothetical protein